MRRNRTQRLIIEYVLDDSLDGATGLLAELSLLVDPELLRRAVKVKVRRRVGRRPIPVIERHGKRKFEDIDEPYPTNEDSKRSKLEYLSKTI